jgi:hypothetical protein
MGVGDKVGVGVRVGSSGVNVCVAVGVPKPVLGMNGSAVWDSATAAVWAMAVPTTFGSGVEIVGEAHAREAINKTTTEARIGFNLSISFSFRLTTAIIILKTKHHPLIIKTFIG